MQNVHLFIENNFFMETSVIITTVIFLAIFIIPFYIISRKRSKKTELLEKKFKILGESQKLHISEQDIWGNRGFGIDRGSKCVLYARGKEFAEKMEIIDLQKIRRSEINKISRSVDNMNIIDRIDLRIIYKDATLPHLLLEFYNVLENRQIDEEIQLAEKWVKIINKNL